MSRFLWFTAYRHLPRLILMHC